MATIADAVDQAAREAGHDQSQPILTTVAQLVEWPNGVTVAARVVSTVTEIPRGTLRTPMGGQMLRSAELTQPQSLWTVVVADGTAAITLVALTPDSVSKLERGALVVLRNVQPFLVPVHTIAASRALSKEPLQQPAALSSSGAVDACMALLLHEPWSQVSSVDVSTPEAGAVPAVTAAAEAVPALDTIFDGKLTVRDLTAELVRHPPHWAVDGHGGGRGRGGGRGGRRGGGFGHRHPDGRSGGRRSGYGHQQAGRGHHGGGGGVRGHAGAPSFAGQLASEEQAAAAAASHPQAAAAGGAGGAGGGGRPAGGDRWSPATGAGPPAWTPLASSAAASRQPAAVGGSVLVSAAAVTAQPQQPQQGGQVAIGGAVAPASQAVGAERGGIAPGTDAAPAKVLGGYAGAAARGAKAARSAGGNNNAPRTAAAGPSSGTVAGTVVPAPGTAAAALQ